MNTRRISLNRIDDKTAVLHLCHQEKLIVERNTCGQAL